MLERFKVPDEIAVHVDFQDMHTAVTQIFIALGSSKDDAVRCANTLMYADVRGIDSHGVSNMMRFYVDGIRSGGINPSPTWSIVRESAAVATIDCDRGLGLTIGPVAMDLAIEKARECGIGSVVATNGRHFGAAAFHAHRAIEHDMIGISMTVGGLQVAPTFASKPLVGLNPLAVAAPSKSQPPFVFDASMSSVAGNKIRLARRLGVNILPGWIGTGEGVPIMEEQPVPDDFVMLPTGGTREIGSHKGYSLAMMVDILSGVLSGSGPGFATRQGVSHHFLAYRVDAFTDLNIFKNDMDSYLEEIRTCPPAPGHDRVFYAGLQAHETEIIRRREGVPYHPEVIEWFHGLLEELEIIDPLPVL